MSNKIKLHFSFVDVFGYVYATFIFNGVSSYCIIGKPKPYDYL